MQMVVFGDANSKRAFPRSPGWRWRRGFGGALIAAGSFRPTTRRTPRSSGGQPRPWLGNSRYRTPRLRSHGGGLRISGGVKRGFQ